MSTPNILVILGTIRPNGNGHRVANWFMKNVASVQNGTFELVDLRDFPLPLFADAVNPSMREGTHENPEVQKWLDKVNAADGYIFITPEYNHSYSSALKNALDYPFKEWHNKPVGFVGYGAVAGGARAVEHLRQVVAELAMYDIREQILIPEVWATFDEQGNPKHHESLSQLAVTIATKVADLAAKLKA